MKSKSTMNLKFLKNKLMNIAKKYKNRIELDDDLLSIYGFK